MWTASAASLAAVAPAAGPRAVARRSPHAGPTRAARRGWGRTDSRFSKLDKRRDGEVGRVELPDEPRDGDAERNISFQELRRRQDREQQRVSVAEGSLCLRRRPGVSSAEAPTTERHKPGSPVFFGVEHVFVAAAAAPAYS